MSYDPSNPRTHAHPASNYQNSNFRKILKQFPKTTITDDMVKNGMSQTELASWESVGSTYTLSQKAARFWTGNEYKGVQRALRDDNDAALRRYMPLIRAINLYVSNQATPQAMVTYRKSKLSGNQLKPYKMAKKGQFFRHATYTATTRESSIALGWEGSCLIKYIIPKGCLNARNLSQVSQHPSEKEVLLPPYTVVKFEQLKESTTATDLGLGKIGELQLERLKKIPFIELTVLDNYEFSRKEKAGTVSTVYKFEEDTPNDEEKAMFCKMLQPKGLNKIILKNFILGGLKKFGIDAKIQDISKTAYRVLIDSYSSVPSAKGTVSKGSQFYLAEKILKLLQQSSAKHRISAEISKHSIIADFQIKDAALMLSLKICDDSMMNPVLINITIPQEELTKAIKDLLPNISTLIASCHN